MAKKIVKTFDCTPGKLAKVTLAQVKKLLSSGYTVGQVAGKYGVSRVALYAKFPGIKGISGHGNRVTKKIR